MPKLISKITYQIGRLPWSRQEPGREAGACPCTYPPVAAGGLALWAMVLEIQKRIECVNYPAL